MNGREEVEEKGRSGREDGDEVRVEYMLAAVSGRYGRIMLRRGDRHSGSKDKR
jgi:hypothetical protein